MTARPMLFLVGLVSGCLLASTGAAQEPEDDPPTVKVQIMIHFGLPDPVFEISNPDDLSTMRELIRDLPDGVEPKDSFYVFGGFALRADEARCRFPAAVTVSKGIIAVHPSGGPKRIFQDTKGFETFLRAKAAEAGLGSELPELPAP